ncbi:MAG: hypothetical protein RLZZ15_242 [Verrucomicrobiota bacterium]
MPRHDDTITALATPVGTAAIAVVRVSGPGAAGLAAEIFGAAAAGGAPRTLRRADYVDRGGAVVDDVLFTVFRGPQPYTGEDAVEISCHGNPLIARKILDDLVARGCRLAEPGEFTRRAFLGGRMDLSQAEAVMDLIHARSERALAMANQQLRGALGRRIGALVEGLLAVLARVEAYIDFPEEDLPPEDRERVAAELERLKSETVKLLATNHYSEILRGGIRTVIVGAPNVGKSSLLNRLVGRERALVSPEPGTTRDFIEEAIMVGAHCVRLIDTAGLNPSPAPLEQRGMEKTWEQAAEADLILLVVDATEPTASEEVWMERMAAFPANAKRLIVFNKIDLRESERLEVPTGMEVGRVGVSALTGVGTEELVAAIGALADSFQTELGDESIAVSARHAGALRRAEEGLIAAQEKLRGAEATELLAADLRGALDAYGEITGRIDHERVLDHLFASFCIGK